MIGSATGISPHQVSFQFDRNRNAPASGEAEGKPGSNGIDRKSPLPAADKAKEKENAEASNKLTPEEEEQVKELKKRDAQVRTHEMAHLAAAGNLARGGPSYEFQTGPDGRSYAIGGHVQIDTSPGRTPAETIAKAAQIRAAALAPADPSPQDMKVASAADRLATAARQKLASEENDNQGSNGKTPDPTKSSDTKQRISFQFSNELERFAEEKDDESSEFDPNSNPPSKDGLVRRAYGNADKQPSDSKPNFGAFA